MLVLGAILAASCRSCRKVKMNPQRRLTAPASVENVPRIRETSKTPLHPPALDEAAREPRLLRCIDEDPDSVVFFADGGGLWQVGADWREVLPAYFRCLAEGASGAEFAREVDQAITDFADHDRPHQLTAARRVASVEQKAALRRGATPRGRPQRSRT